MYSINSPCVFRQSGVAADVLHPPEFISSLKRDGKRKKERGGNDPSKKGDLDSGRGLGLDFGCRGVYLLSNYVESQCGGEGRPEIFVDIRGGYV